jgi:hypothetical protein
VPKFQDLFGTDRFGTIAIGMISNSLAPATYTNYYISLRRLMRQDILPLHATLATLSRYTAWLGALGTVAAGSL